MALNTHLQFNSEAKNHKRLYAVLFLVYALLQLHIAANRSFLLDEFIELDIIRRMAEEGVRPGYRNILGAYLASIFYTRYEEPLNLLVAIKISSVLVHLTAIFFLFRALINYVTKTSATLVIGAIVTTYPILNFTAAAKWDSITGSLGALSLAAMIASQPLVAGLLVGFAFLISKKAIIYVIAATLGYMYLYFKTHEKPHFLKSELMRFVIGFLIIASIYYAIMIFVIGFDGVARSASHTTLNRIKKDFLYPARFIWELNIKKSPLFFIAILCGLSVNLKALIQSFKTHAYGHIIVFSVICALLQVLNPSPWPYTLGLVMLVISPLLLYNANWFKGLLAICICTQFIFIYQITKSDKDAQFANINLARALLKTGDDYYDGMQMLPGQKQSPHLPVWLDMWTYNELVQQDLTTMNKTLENIQKSPPKLIIDNFRVQRLPPPILKFFKENYFHLWGNVFTYAPRFAKGRGGFELRYSGKYKVGASKTAKLTINGQIMTPLQTIVLNSGSFNWESTEDFQLLWVPEVDLTHLPPEFQNPIHCLNFDYCQDTQYDTMR